ncbi:hypothetical protein INQ25_04385 [Wolbachia endosymbiont of Rhagoletis cerasi]|uniref:hypothetical protein n=1 Tax=Wolbachia endosymbiont of Rhagoletis cerasi TaxID=225363 RepID=UPI001BD44B0A|nr:hypothetical protein [Wolbachia endosymbiont of Rhagoletis cerasi]MBS9530612.1 hypothetical protein [Wolbachia endosymbiont of Rhagoletis cerasi]MBS9530613.1 hypothetical protein [Wolbachia endosymbiont of Rhagoletis cerasi]MBS9530614.1 hypothetical protein [Wolbachia endosymbiont of Rhagoletis cerasi]MBS9530615.1 hypothetical protein [Wolbachia endosymbiont of Rhagoletis cerasi]MBS9530616.1 hypothetical protein [Wolbachia endosymbiont of Rhagoletis cerasi]
MTGIIITIIHLVENLEEVTIRGLLVLVLVSATEIGRNLVIMIHHQVFIKSKLLALPLVIPVLNTGMTRGKERWSK